MLCIKKNSRNFGECDIQQIFKIQKARIWSITDFTKKSHAIDELEKAFGDWTWKLEWRILPAKNLIQ